MATTLTYPEPVRASARPASARTRPPQPRWVLPALLSLLGGTALLYLWGLGASGYANSFYAAAVQAGTQSWKALLFGSLDAGNAITVDKPPASLWIMGLSARLFGFNSWSLLVPQALMGVASVGLLFAAVRRQFGPVAGLAAGAILALTPVAVLMFRFDNPDALLVLLLTAAAYAVVRATERASGWWLALAGVLVGFGFLTKMMQAFLVVPGFGLAYLIAAPTSLRKRLLHLTAALGAMVVSAGWFVALVEFWPASSRPYIGGSTDNSLWQLAMGYNGFSRIFGASGAGGGIGGGGNTSTAFGGATGITRLFGTSMGGEISWLLPAALVALGLGVWLTWGRPRADATRAALLLWGSWLLVTGLVFSYMSGITHPYYTVALAPAIAALVAIVGRGLWLRRTELPARSGLAALILITTVWNIVLLSRVDWLPGLRWFILIGGVLAAGALFLAPLEQRRVAMTALAAAVIMGLTGSSAYAIATASVAHSGSIPTSGPVSAGGMGGGGGFSMGDGGGAGMGGAGMGGGEQTSGDSELTTLLQASTTRWAAAITGATSAANLELTSGKSVMAIGGWSGDDPAPTLAQFQQYVAAGEIHYLIASGGNGGGGGTGGPGGGTGTYSDIVSWVQEHYTATTVGSTTVYDLTQSSSD